MSNKKLAKRLMNVASLLLANERVTEQHIKEIDNKMGIAFADSVEILEAAGLEYDTAKALLTPLQMAIAESLNNLSR